MHLFFSLIVTFEIALIILAIFSIIRRYVLSVPEAFSYSTISALSILSVCIHFFFMLGIHSFFFLFDIFAVSVSMWLLYKNFQIIIDSCRIFKLFVKNNPIYTCVLSFVFLCLFVKGFLLPPTTWDSLTYHLTRIVLMQAEGRLYLENFNDYRLDTMQIGYDILYFLYLRFYTDFGLATFGFISYLTIISSIYTLTDKLFSKVQLSKAISFIGAALPLLVISASSTKNDLILGAAAIIIFISAINYLQSKCVIHLYILCTTLLFGLTIKSTFAAFAFPFLFFFGLYLLYKFGIKHFLSVIKTINQKYIPLLVLPFASAIILAIFLNHNYSIYGNLLGPEKIISSFPRNDNALKIAANLLRFSLQSMDLPKEFGGSALNKIHDLILGEHKNIGILFPDQHLIVDVCGSLNPTDVDGWYGLLGIPILLSIVFVLFRGPGFLRIISITALFSIVFVCIKVPWTPWNGRYYIVTFIIGLFCMGSIFDQISKKHSRIFKGLAGIAILVSSLNLFYLAIYDNVTQFPLLYNLINNRDRAYYPKLCSEGSWKHFIHEIPPGSSVLVIAGSDTGIFPILFRRPDLNITVTGFKSKFHFEPFRFKGVNYDLSQKEDFKKVHKLFDTILMFRVPEKYYQYYMSE